MSRTVPPATDTAPTLKPLRGRSVRSRYRDRLAVAVAMLVGAAALTTGSAPALAKTNCTVTNGLGTFSAASPPGPCWRPYANSSPFNKLIGRRAKPVRNSSAMVAELRDHSDDPQFLAGDPRFDVGHPIYFSSPADPLVKVHCTYSAEWGPCEVEGAVVRIPAQALPTGGFSTPSNEHDAHMVVVDQSTGWEYDFWLVQGLGGGRLTIGYGGRTKIDGNGLGSDATAAQYGNLAGLIRAKELMAGRIHHAVGLVVPCTEGHVYPATKGGQPCSDLGVENGIPMGAHFQLKIKAKTIRRMRVPDWKKAVMWALKRYGGYVRDSTGSREWWGLVFESRAPYAAFGLPDPWVQLAQRSGIEGNDWTGNGYPEYRFDFAKDFPWHRLRIIK